MNNPEVKGPSAADVAAAEVLNRNAQANPANEGAAAAEAQPARRRIPLSVPRRKLEVAPIPGYVLYWFLDADILSAREGGYDFVDRTEVRLNQLGLASSTDDSGNTDLGSRVSILGNKFNEAGRPELLTLMKIREEWWREDRQILDAANAATVDAIFGQQRILGGDQANPADSSKAYVKQANLEKPHGRRPGLQGGILNRGLPKKT